MLKTILALALSAATMAALGAVSVHVLAGTEAGFLQAQEHALRAEVAAAEGELRRLPAEARRVAMAMTADPNLGPNLRALSATLGMLESATNPKLVKALQARADLLGRQLKQNSDAGHKRNPDADTLVFMGADGMVLHADSARLSVGDNLREAAGKEPPWDLALKALGGAAQSGVRIGTQAPYVWFVYFEPVLVKGKLAGAVLAELPLRKPPPGLGSQVLLSVDNRVVFGKEPSGFDGTHVPLGKVGLVAPRLIEGHAGAFSMPLVEVDPDHMGIWGARFRLPNTDRAAGWVLQDLSEDYRDLGERQLQVTVLAGMGWFVLAMLYSFVAFSARAGRSPAEATGTQVAPLDVTDVEAATEPDSPWGDLPLGAVETVDDGYQTLDSFDLGGADPAETPVAPLVSEGPAQAVSRPAVLLGDLLETTVPEQVESDAGDGWNDVSVSPESAAAAFEPALDLFAPAPELTRAADEAVAEAAPASGGPTARDQLLSMLQSKKAAPARPAAEAPEIEDAGVLEPEALELEPELELETEPELELELEAEPVDPVEAARQKHYREVYDEFVRLRRSCSEPGELPFDKFLGRLTDTRAAVIAKHGCEDVMFAAYVKNGKAALKATPR